MTYLLQLGHFPNVCFRGRLTFSHVKLIIYICVAIIIIKAILSVPVLTYQSDSHFAKCECNFEQKGKIK